MTIYTSKVADKKDENEIPSPEVVTEYMLLVEDEKKKEAESKQAVVVVSAAAPRRRHPLLNLCVILLGLILLVTLIIGGISLYRHLNHVLYQGRCGVRYHGDIDENDMVAMPSVGEFEQEVEIDKQYEKIEVPTIGDTRRATVLHDFNQNLTAIIDKEQSNCFIMPLNRTLVMPPRDFMDLLVKLKTGYYIPDAEVVRETYRAVTPPIEDLSLLGLYVQNECRFFDTYLLVKDGEPFAMSKRSACAVSGQKYCLGEASPKKMLCINIGGCF